MTRVCAFCRSLHFFKKTPARLVPAHIVDMYNNTCTMMQGKILFNFFEIRASIIVGYKQMNAEVEKREKEREEKCAVNLQPVLTQEPRNFVR